MHRSNASSHHFTSAARASRFPRTVRAMLLVLFALLTGACLVQPVSTECSARTQCGDCTMRSGCGWCVATAMCNPGSSFGPLSGRCDTWVFDQQQCGNAPPRDAGTTPDARPSNTPRCEDITDCTACVQSRTLACRYCEATNRCLPVTAACASAAVSALECEAIQFDGCRDITDCSRCQRTTGCGWCNGRCVQGSSSVPDYAYDCDGTWAPGDPWICD